MNAVANWLLAAVLSVWLFNVIYACRKLKNRLVFFVFHGMLFLFLLGRPLIDWVCAGDWAGLEIRDCGVREQGITTALLCILVSMICLLLGSAAAEKSTGHAAPAPDLGQNTGVIPVIRIWALAIFAVSVVCEAVFEGEKVLFVLEHSYVEYYTTYASRLPYWIYVGSSFMEYAACLYLATLPGLPGSWIVCGVMALTALPMFLMGNRAVLMLKLVFLFVYLVYRQTQEHGGKWFGKWHCLALAAALPGMMVLMNAVNYIREKTAMAPMSVFEMLLDFVRKQGVTFSWLCAGCSIVDRLRALCPVSYTFASFLEYAGSGMIAQKIFGASPLPTDLVQNALANHRLDCKLSYLVLGEAKFLAGHGTGTTYLLEVFSDFGLLGVGVFSLLLGFAMTAAVIKARNSMPVRFGLLCTAVKLFYMPRSSAVDCFEFLWRAPFWLLVVSTAAVVWMYRMLCKRRS